MRDQVVDFFVNYKPAHVAKKRREGNVSDDVALILHTVLKNNNYILLFLINVIQRELFHWILLSFCSKATIIYNLFRRIC